MKDDIVSHLHTSSCTHGSKGELLVISEPRRATLHDQTPFWWTRRPPIEDLFCWLNNWLVLSKGHWGKLEAEKGLWSWSVQLLQVYTQTPPRQALAHVLPKIFDLIGLKKIEQVNWFCKESSIFWTTSGNSRSDWIFDTYCTGSAIRNAKFIEKSQCLFGSFKSNDDSKILPGTAFETSATSTVTIGPAWRFTHDSKLSTSKTSSPILLAKAVRSSTLGNWKLMSGNYTLIECVSKRSAPWVEMCPSFKETKRKTNPLDCRQLPGRRRTGFFCKWDLKKAWSQESDSPERFMKMELHAVLDFFMRWTTTDASGYHYMFAARILSLSAFLDSQMRKSWVTCHF